MRRTHLVVFALLLTLLLSQCSPLTAQLDNSWIQFYPSLQGYYSTLRVGFDFPTGMSARNSDLAKQNLRYQHGSDLTFSSSDFVVEPGYYSKVGTMSIVGSELFFNPKYRQVHCTAKLHHVEGGTFTPLRVELLFPTKAVTVPYKSPITTSTAALYTTAELYLYEPNLQLRVDFIPAGASFSFDCPQDLAIISSVASPQTTPELLLSIFPGLLDADLNFNLNFALEDPSTAIPTFTATSFEVTPIYTTTITYTPGQAAGSDVVFFNSLTNTVSVQNHVVKNYLESTGIPCYATSDSNKIVGRFFYNYSVRSDLSIPPHGSQASHLSLINADEECRFDLELLASDAARALTLSLPVKEQVYAVNGFSTLPLCPAGPQFTLDQTTDLPTTAFDVTSGYPQNEFPLVEAKVTGEYSFDLTISTFFTAPPTAFDEITLLVSPFPTSGSFQVTCDGSLMELTSSIVLPLPAVQVGPYAPKCTVAPTSGSTLTQSFVFIVTQSATDLVIHSTSDLGLIPSSETLTTFTIHPWSTASSTLSPAIEYCGTGTCFNLVATFTPSFSSQFNWVIWAPSTVLFDIDSVDANPSCDLLHSSLDSANPTLTQYIFRIGSIPTSGQDATLSLNLPIVHTAGNSVHYPITSTTQFFYSIVPDVYAYSFSPATVASTTFFSLPAVETANIRYARYQVGGIDSIWYRHPQLLEESPIDRIAEVFPFTLYTHLLNAWRLLTAQAIPSMDLSDLDNALYFVISRTNNRVAVDHYDLSVSYDGVVADLEPGMHWQDSRFVDTPEQRHKIRGTVPVFEITFGYKYDGTNSPDIQIPFTKMKSVLNSVFKSTASTDLTDFSLGESLDYCFDIPLSQRPTDSAGAACFPPLDMYPHATDTMSSLTPTLSPFLFDPIFAEAPFGGSPFQLAPGVVVRFNINVAYFLNNASDLISIMTDGFTVVFDYGNFEYGLPVGTWGTLEMSKGQMYPYLLRVPEVKQVPVGIRMVPNEPSTTFPLMQFTEMSFKSPAESFGLQGLKFASSEDGGAPFQLLSTPRSPPLQLTCPPSMTCDCHDLIFDEDILCEAEPVCGEIPIPNSELTACVCSESTNFGEAKFGPLCTDHINLYAISLSYTNIDEAQSAYGKLLIKHKLLSVLHPGVPVNSLRLRVYLPPYVLPPLLQGEVRESLSYFVGEVNLLAYGLHTSSRHVPKFPLDTTGDPSPLNHLDLIFHLRMDDLTQNDATLPNVFPTMCTDSFPASTPCLDVLSTIPPDTNPPQSPMRYATYLTGHQFIHPTYPINPLYLQNQSIDIFLSYPPPYLTQNELFAAERLYSKYSSSFQYPVPHLWSNNQTDAIVYQLFVVIQVDGFNFKIPASVQISPKSLPQSWFGSLLQEYQHNGLLLNDIATLPVKGGVSVEYSFSESSPDWHWEYTPTLLVSDVCSVASQIRLTPRPYDSDGDIDFDFECIEEGDGVHIYQVSPYDSDAFYFNIRPTDMISTGFLMDIEFETDWEAISPLAEETFVNANGSPIPFTARMLQAEIKHIFNATYGLPVQDFRLIDIQVDGTSTHIHGLFVPSGYVDLDIFTSILTNPAQFKMSVPDGQGFTVLIGLAYTLSQFNVYGLPTINYLNYVPSGKIRVSGLTTIVGNAPSNALKNNFRIDGSKIVVDTPQRSLDLSIPLETTITFDGPTSPFDRINFKFDYKFNDYFAGYVHYYPPRRTTAIDNPSCDGFEYFGPSCRFELILRNPRTASYPENYVFDMALLQPTQSELEPITEPDFVTVLWSLTSDEFTSTYTQTYPFGTSFPLNLHEVLGSNAFNALDDYTLSLQFFLNDDPTTLYIYTVDTFKIEGRWEGCYLPGTATTSYSISGSTTTCGCGDGYLGVHCDTLATLVADSTCSFDGTINTFKIRLKALVMGQEPSIPASYALFKPEDVQYHVSTFPTTSDSSGEGYKEFKLTNLDITVVTSVRLQLNPPNYTPIGTLQAVTTTLPSCCGTPLSPNHIFIGLSCAQLTLPFPEHALIVANQQLTLMLETQYSAQLEMDLASTQQNVPYNQNFIPSDVYNTYPLTNETTLEGGEYRYRDIKLTISDANSGSVATRYFRLVSICDYLRFTNINKVCGAFTQACQFDAPNIGTCLCQPGAFGDLCDSKESTLTLTSFEIENRQITVNWNQPIPNYPEDSFHFFKLFPYSTTKPTDFTTAQAILTLPAGSTLGKEGTENLTADISGAIFVPSRASTVKLVVPDHVNLTAGFTVVMQHVGDPSPSTSHSTVFTSYSFTGSLLPKTCQNTPKSSTYCIDQTVTCPYSCPPRFTRNEVDCTCSCTTDDCRAYSRSTILYLDDTILATTIANDPKNFLAELRNNIVSQMCLNQLPAPDLSASYYLNIPSWMPSPVQYFGFPSCTPNRVKPFGIEKLTIVPIQPTSKTLNLSAFILTITVERFATTSPSAITQRFKALDSALSQISSFSIQFVKQLTFLPSTSINRVELTSYPSFAVPIKALCKAPFDTATLPATCPPISQLTSPLWSKCSATTTNKQYIFPVCVDLKGNMFFSPEARTASSLFSPPAFPATVRTAVWCHAGMPNFPSPLNLSVESCSKKTYPDPPRIQALRISSSSLSPTDSFTLDWTYPDGADPIYTANIYISNPAMTYRRTLLLNHVAKSGAVTLQLPTNIAPHAQSVITIQINQLATSTASIQVAVTELNLCPSDLTGYCQSNATCQKLTGECACNTGYAFTPEALADPAFSTKTATCALSCPNDCHSSHGNGVCTLDTNSSSHTSCQCSESWQGVSCERRVSCVDQEATKCSNHGFVNFDPDNSTCSSRCTCDTNWGTFLDTDTSQCSRCMLLKTNGGDCHDAGTDVDVTITNDCTKCICKRGYSGALCSTLTLYGTIRFSSDQTTDQLTILSISPLSTLSPFSFSPQDITTGLDLVSEEGRDVLSQDLALSLGLPPSAISTARITQSTTSTGPRVQEPFQLLQSSPSQTNVTFAVASNSADASQPAFDMNDLYAQWGKIQDSQTFPSTPIAQTEAAKEVGTPTGADDAYDPNCTGSSCPTGFDPFADPSDPDPNTSTASGGNSPTATIIGVVVGGGLAIALFAATILIARHGKKHRKWCWKPAKDNNNDHLELTMETSRAINTTTHDNETTRSGKSGKSGKSTTNSAPYSSGTATSIDLIDITEDTDGLTDGWKKMQHCHTNQILFVNDEKMISQKHHPNEKGSDGNGFSFA